MKKTIVDQIEIKRDGTMQIRMRKMLIDEDGVAHDLGYHRTAIPPGVDVDSQFAAVNTNLQSMGVGAVAAEELTTLKAILPVVHTPAVVEAYKTLVGMSVKEN